jgi:hypothetical protein
MYILKKLYNNKVIKIRLENFLIPPPPPLYKNGRLTHVNPKLYTKCPLRRKVTTFGDGSLFPKDEVLTCL